MEIKQYDPPISFMDASEYIPKLMRKIQDDVEEFESKFPVKIKSIKYRNGIITIETGRLQMSMDIKKKGD